MCHVLLLHNDIFLLNTIKADTDFQFPCSTISIVHPVITVSRFKSGLRKDKYSINTKLLPRVEENTIAAANCDSAQKNDLLILRETWTFGMFGACEST